MCRSTNLSDYNFSRNLLHIKGFQTTTTTKKMMTNYNYEGWVVFVVGQPEHCGATFNIQLLTLLASFEFSLLGKKYFQIFCFKMCCKLFYLFNLKHLGLQYFKSHWYNCFCQNFKVTKKIHLQLMSVSYLCKKV